MKDSVVCLKDIGDMKNYSKNRNATDVGGYIRGMNFLHYNFDNDLNQILDPFSGIDFVNKPAKLYGITGIVEGVSGLDTYKSKVDKNENFTFVDTTIAASKDLAKLMKYKYKVIHDIITENGVEKRYLRTISVNGFDRIIEDTYKKHLANEPGYRTSAEIEQTLMRNHTFFRETKVFLHSFGVVSMAYPIARVVVNPDAMYTLKFFSDDRAGYYYDKLINYPCSKGI